MAVTTISTIQHRRGVRSDLPTNLREGELGWCLDTQELFIGNTEATGGNTQVLTNATDLASVVNYSFVSDTSVVSQTGSSLAQPVVRSLQNQLDDAWVNVKAYGAQGDGITDDTAAINRAIQDLYTKILSTSEAVQQARKAVWLPSGVYVISEPLLLYPQVRLVGEHSVTTEVRLVSLTPQPCVVTVVDSAGQQQGSMGNNGAVLPSDITVSDITFTATDDQTVVRLQRCSNILFERCVLAGNWSTGSGSTGGQAAILIESLGALIETSNISFVNCNIHSTVWALFVNDPIKYVSLNACTFNNLYRAVYLGATPYLNGASYTRISNCVFSNLDDRAIVVLSSNPGVTSVNNTFANVGTVTMVEPVFWGASSTLCTSMADVFDSLPAVIDNGANNLIVDAQQNNLGRIRTVRTATSTPVTVAPSDDVIIVALTVPGISAVNLAADPAVGRTHTIKDGSLNSATYTITVNPASGTIDGQPSATLTTNGAAITLIYSGTEWNII